MKNKTFIYQTNSSGNANGHFDISDKFESKEALLEHLLGFYHYVFNVIEVTPESKIGDYEFATSDPNYDSFKGEAL